MIAALLCCIIAYAQTETRMTEKTHGIQEVVVTGTGTKHLLKDAPVQTEVISRKMLESYGGKNIEDILGALTASFAFNEGDMGSQMQLGGLGNSYILILVDGKRLHGDNGGENDLGLIDPHSIERIEIVKGAQSALYGSDAIAGVINIITKPLVLPSKGKAVSIAANNTTRFGTGGGMDYDVRQHDGFGIGNKKWQSYTSFQLQTSSGWQNTTEEYAEAQVIPDSKNKTVNRFRNWQVGERLTFTPAKNMELYAEGTYYIKDIMRPHEPQRASIVQNGYDLMYRNASAAVGGSMPLFSHKLREQNTLTQGALSFDVSWNKHAYYYNYMVKTYDDIYYKGEVIHDFPYLPGDQSLQSDQQRVLANVKAVTPLPAGNLLSSGLEFRYDYLEAPVRVEGGEASDWTGALYVQDEFSMVRWLNVTAGLRLNQNGAFGFRATPKLSTMVSLGDFRLRAGWSQGFKTPTPKELHYRYLRAMGSKMFYYMGNPDLDAQTSNYWSAGVEYRGSCLTVSVTAYRNKLDNMITLVNVPVGEIPKDQREFMGDGSMEITPRMYKNMENARTQGIDVNMSYNINKEWTLGGNYSYLDTDANVYNESRHRLDNVTIDGMAHHKWNAYATWQHSFSPAYRLTAGLYGRGSSKRYYQNDGDGKAFQIWRLTTSHDLSASSTHTGGRGGKGLAYHFEFGVDNIFNYVDRTMRPYHLGTTACGTNVFASFSIRFSQGKKINTKITKQSIHNEED